MEPEHLLWEAVRSNDIETMRLLLGCTCGRFDLSSIIGKRTEQGSDLACSADVSPDTLSTVCGCTSVQVNKKENGLSTLHLAIINNNMEMLTLLIHHGAIFSPCYFSDVKSLDSDDIYFLEEFGPLLSPLILAVAFSDAQIVKFVFQKSPRFDPTALRLACKVCQLESVKVLLEGMKTHAQMSERTSVDSAASMSPLMYATKAKTALFEAVKADNLEVVEVLLNAHADPNIPSAPYESPILYAAEHSSPQVVEALLREGADVNTTDVVGVTPLIYAAKRCADRKSSKQEDITALLLRYGADMTHKYLHTHTALSIAVACGNIRCAKVLIEAGAEVRETPRSGKLMLLHIVKNRECAELLLKHGVPVDHLNSAHKTALMIACRDNKVDMARLLMEHGADVNKTTLEGISPLFYAVNNDSAVLVKDLIMAGACNVNDHLLIYFRSLLELALFLKASHHVCHLLHLAGAVVRSSFPSFRALYNSSSYLHFINMTVPPELWHCKLWAKFRTRTSFSGYDGLEESFMVHSKMMSLEERCCHMLRKYLNFNKQAMRTLSLPQHVISKLMMEIY
ncbi:ankyrin-1-like isoform X3 [Gigantopelta aegis]|uniref:ankyrin-1-like isoform X3 n=1 Tax=Gigantopelta aegis TaxID=1735272 RepID=UPI001B88757D|nr:ankyrin-1-like isoform X3 [Gigantopelta aegis]